MINSLDKDKHTDADPIARMAELVAKLPRDQIEKLTIDAIREHRAAIAMAESAYQAWKASEDHGDVERLQNEYTKLMLASRAQQMIVATLVEHLGHIPDVPATPET